MLDSYIFKSYLNMVYLDVDNANPITVRRIPRKLQAVLIQSWTGELYEYDLPRESDPFQSCHVNAKLYNAYNKKTSIPSMCN
jgi:hypothetical protein